MTRLYFDYQSSTPVDPKVLNIMMPFFTERFGNPHSQGHDFGLDAHNAIETAREQLAQSIGASSDEIIFTSGATESNNLALCGLLDRDDNHIISCVAEHHSVLSTLKALERQGTGITLIGVDADGMIDPDEIRKAITPQTRAVSIMTVNNETGVIQNVDEIGYLCKEHEVVFHSDGAQALGKTPINVKSQQIDMLSLSSHKTYGPMGVGALYCEAKLKKKIKPIMWGGGQENGIRPGTIPTPLAVGFGAAAVLAVQNEIDESKRLLVMRDRFLRNVMEQCDGVNVNGSTEHRIAGNLNLCISDVDAESLMHAMPDVAMSTGSACSFSATEPSHVLMAMGLSYEEASSSIRIGIGRFTIEEDVDAAADCLASTVNHLR